jgi:hypothetical protein
MTLIELYQRCNTDFWDGRLPSAQETVTDVTRLGGDPADRGVIVRPYQGSRIMRGEHGQFLLGCFRAPGDTWPATIVIDLERAPSGHAAGVRGVLLHQLIHYALYFDGCPDPLPHGFRFLAELKRLGARGEPWALWEAEVLSTLVCDHTTIGHPGRLPIEDYV